MTLGVNMNLQWNFQTMVFTLREIPAWAIQSGRKNPAIVPPQPNMAIA